MPAKKGGFSPLSILKSIKDFWPFIALAGGFILTIAFLPQKVSAIERRVEKTESRQQTIEEYIQVQQKTQELIRKAPSGYRWNFITEEFEIDPYYKRKKVR